MVAPGPHFSVNGYLRSRSVEAAFILPQHPMPDGDWPPMRWDRQNTQEPLTISNNGLTLSWKSDLKGDLLQPIWLGSQTTARLSNGIFWWDFDIESIADHQIGVGILLEPPDWGFFGYLGAGKNAWSYDAFEGAIVTETKAIHSGLPTIRKRGNVTVHLDLKKKNECVFVVNGVRTPAISLP